jgi:Flp pilus assembly pilin Flp
MSKEKTPTNPKRSFFRFLWRDRRGATMVEYGAIVACVLVAGYAAFKTLGSNVSTTVNSAATDIGGGSH